MAIEQASNYGDSPNTWQTAIIEQITRETPTVKTFRLRPSRWITFKAGQHLEMRLTALDGYSAQRSYSIGSSPDNSGVYDVTIEQLKDGEVSGWFHDVAETGDQLEIRGPFGGHFIWKPADQDPILLVAGGSGVVPIMSMIRHRARSAPDTPATLLYGARTWDGVIYRDELVSREQWEPHLSVLFALSRGEATRPEDFASRINLAIVSAAIDRLKTAPKVSYICGSNAFAEAAAQLLLQAGIDARSIRIERFGD